jgi:hypothetical protein
VTSSKALHWPTPPSFRARMNTTQAVLQIVKRLPCYGRKKLIFAHGDRRRSCENILQTILWCHAECNSHLKKLNSSKVAECLLIACQAVSSDWAWETRFVDCDLAWRTGSSGNDSESRSPGATSNLANKPALAKLVSK